MKSTIPSSHQVQYFHDYCSHLMKQRSVRYLGKSILEGNVYLGPLEIILRTLALGLTFRLHVITCLAGG